MGMSRFPVAIAVVGGPEPAWVRQLPPGMAETHIVRVGAVEDGLNGALAASRAPCLLPVQADDRIRPEGLLALVDTLQHAPPAAVGAVAPAEQVRRDGGLRFTPATPAANPPDLLALGRIGTPVLFRTAALRDAGGWRPGEAAWGDRAHRHRTLLARLLENGHLVAAPENLGTIARPGPVSRPDPPPVPGDLPAALAKLLYHPVAITGAGGELNARGRIAALNDGLVTLATEGGGVMLIKLSEISAVEAVTADPGSQRGPWPGRFRPHT